ncbi:MAG TPA: mucoidy inhibitor MuiA family protein [Kofleriaceae bacterium]|nr:mucoidy inhibitor MuiA family protein [Kofleriaceae bacterium]
MELTPVVSELDSVTVYSQGAVVTRVGTIARDQAGFPGAVRITGLPLSLRDDSVRVRVEAMGDGPAPAAVDARVTLEVPLPDTRVRPALDADLDSARRAERLAAARVERTRGELARLKKLAVLPRPAGADGEPPGPSPIEARLALLELREQEERRLRAEQRQLERALEDASRTRQTLEEEERRATTSRQAHEHELRKTVIVALDSNGAACEQARLFVEYQVPGARWAPAYSVRLDRTLRRGELEMRAVVGQRTGEDWQGARLTLSTAEMLRWTELPELTSIRIGRRQPVPPKTGWRPPPTGAAELYRDWDRVFAGRLEPRPTVVAAGPSSGYPSEPEESVAEWDEEPVTAAHELDSFASMPPPMPRSAPAPAAPMVKRAAKKSGLLGEILGGLGGAPSGGAAPPPQAMRSRAPERTEMMAERSFGAAALQEPEPAVTAPGELLRYGELRMPPPEDPGRGHLTVTTRQEIYLQLLMAQEIQVQFDVLGALATAERRASDLADRELPSGCRYAWSKSYDYAYRASAAVDVPSDGNFHTVPLARADADVKPQYVVVPRETAEVFRTAALDNPLDAPLLGGPVDVYIGGDFLLTSSIDFTPARGAIDLGLGVEQAIKVSRNTHYREESAGLIGGSLELRHQVVIDVQNNLGAPASIEVRERIPVLREDEDDIKLAIGPVSPSWEPYEQADESASEPTLRGGYRWHLEVPAGGKQQLRAEYEVKISAKHELVGGNRREA